MKTTIDIKAPLGTWRTYLGGGHDMLIGMVLTFMEDGTGKIEEWGFDHNHLDENYEKVPDFKWSQINKETIEIDYREVKRTVKFELKETKNEYDIPEVRISEVNDQEEESFWLCPYSLVYQEELPKKSWKFWKRK